MKNVQMFNFNGSQVRTLTIDGDPYFIGKDVAEILGYVKPANAIKDHVPSSFKGVTEIMTPGGKQKLTIISEPGMYKLVFKSHAPNAEKFTDWVASEVLPSIRKTGSYQSSDSELPVSPLDKLKLVMQSTVQIGDELRKTQEDVKYLKDHRFIVSGQSNYISSSVSKEVYNWYNSNEARIKWDKKDAIKLLYRDINSQIKSVSGSRTRTTIEVCKYDIVCQLIDNWQPASSTVTQLINSIFKKVRRNNYEI